MTHIDDAQIDELLTHLDHTPPRVTVDDIVARAATANTGRTAAWGARAKAASILIALTVAGAAYAVPGSPVRAWVAAAVSRFTRDGPPPAPRPLRPDSVTAGVAVAPGRALAIRFASRQQTGEVRVALTDSANVAVTALRGAATFASGSERLDIENRGSSATFEIRIPRNAPQITIEVEGARLFLKRGARIESLAPADAAGVYVLPLAPRSP